MLTSEIFDNTFAATYTRSLFNIDSEVVFDKMAVDAFQYQYKNNKVYRTFVDFMKINPKEVDHYEKIPFLPAELFKNNIVLSGTEHYEKVFFSSGTTGIHQSRHYISDLALYEEVFIKTFTYFYGDIKEYCILALLPSYYDNPDSSLLYMADKLIKKSCHKHSGFYLNKNDDLLEILKLLHCIGEKIMLIGVTYALLDLIEHANIPVPQAIIMETGGMKGKRNELVKEELHRKLMEGFSVKQIHSEYGMTELLSQAYSYGNGIFNCPPWMKVLIRDIQAPSYLAGKNKRGGINIMDLANINSCCFIETKDMGILYEDNSFEITGRMDNSDIRGCNQLI